jgi:hypothetical protein
VTRRLFAVTRAALSIAAIVGLLAAVPTLLWWASPGIVEDF